MTFVSRKLKKLYYFNSVSPHEYLLTVDVLMEHTEIDPAFDYKGLEMEISQTTNAGMEATGLVGGERSICARARSFLRMHRV